jgi:hypothetical protein
LRLVSHDTEARVDIAERAWITASAGPVARGFGPVISALAVFREAA